MSGMNFYLNKVETFFKNPEQKSLVKYIRDNKGRRRGVVTAVNKNFDKGESKIYIGWSLYNKNKERVPFDKDMALAHALRHSYDVDIYKSKGYIETEVPHTLKNEVRYMIERAERYFNNKKAKPCKQEREAGAAPENPQTSSSPVQFNTFCVPPGVDEVLLQEKMGKLVTELSKAFPNYAPVVDVYLRPKN